MYLTVVIGITRTERVDTGGVCVSGGRGSEIDLQPEKSKLQLYPAPHPFSVCKYLQAC